MEEVKYKISIGRLWEVAPPTRLFVDALIKAGMTRTQAVWWMLRLKIRLAGGEKQFDPYRVELAQLLRERR